MKLSRRVSLGGDQLDKIDDSIVIRGIDTGAANESISAVSRMGGSGQRVTGSHWNTLDVSVSYAIDIPKKQLALRREVFEKVNAWARKAGWLRVNFMENRRMYVDKVIYPSAGDLRDWTDEYTITFRAYNVPFWQEETPTTYTSGTTAKGSTSMTVNGHVQTVVNATFTNKSGVSFNNLTIKAGSSEIKLAGLGLGGSEKLTVTHGNDGLLKITKGSTSVYSKMSGADDLYVNPGKNTIAFEADRAGVWTFESYGRYIG